MRDRIRMMDGIQMKDRIEKRTELELNDEGKETRAECSLFIPSSTDRRIHISNTASRPETHPALYEGLLRAQAETASIDSCGSGGRS